MTGETSLMPVRVFVPWPEDQGPPDGWPTNYVDHADFCALERVARAVAEAEFTSERVDAVRRLREALGYD
jgi:hypothetical protein